METNNNEVSTVKIGFKQYGIEKPNKIDMFGCGTVYGTVNCDNALIRILSTISQHDKNHTFLHELLHAICMRFGLNDLLDDESSIDLLATGVYEVILDNPHIFSMTDI